MATAPLRSGFAETSSSRRVLGSPLWYRVGPWPERIGSLSETRVEQILGGLRFQQRSFFER